MGVVQVLVAKGANVNAKDVTDLTPLQLAVLSRPFGQNESILKILIANGADVSSADSDGTTALDDATRKGYAGFVEILKRAGAKCGTNEHYSSHCKLAAGSE
jgi:ankyrin repeat protein